MAIAMDWLTKVISVPQADLVSLGGGKYELDANAFRNVLKNIEDSEEGVSFLPILRHSTQSTLSGVVYARQVEIINGYTLSFQNTGTPYTVVVVGANHNFGDVTNFDGGMSMIIGNSAGLISVDTGGGGTTAADIWTYPDRELTAAPAAPTAEANAVAVWTHASALSLIAKQALLEKLLRNKTITDPTTGVMTFYDDDGTTVLFTCNIYENAAGTQAYRGQGVERKERLS